MFKENINYQSIMSSSKETKGYIESISGTFKSRWYRQYNSFSTYKDNRTKLSKNIWFLKKKSKLRHQVVYPSKTYMEDLKIEDNQS